MAHVINLRSIFRQAGPMNCWFYAAKTIIHNQTGRMIMESDYLGPTGSPSGPTSTGRGAGPASWLRFGLPPREVRQFAEEFSFRSPSRPAEWSAQALEETLVRCGPLWFGGASGRFSHVVVLTGIDGTAVHYADPATGNAATCTLIEFNGWKQQTLGIPNPLYYTG